MKAEIRGLSKGNLHEKYEFVRLRNLLGPERIDRWRTGQDH
jgi:hypothetical protein